MQLALAIWSDADPATSIKGGGAFFCYKTKIGFQTICVEKNQQIPRYNSKRKLKKNMVKRKMTRTKRKYSAKTRFYQSMM